MYVKKYAYQIDLAQLDEFKRIQRRSDEIYKQHVNYTLIVMENAVHPGRIEEIQIYLSEESYIEGQQLINKHPEIPLLFQQFLCVLDPSAHDVKEESYKGMF